MTFPVNGNIPQPTDEFSVSQGQIQTNFYNIVGWSAVDHIAYGVNNAGEHAQITLPANNPAGVQTALESTIYSNPGTASNASSQLFYANSQSNFILSAVKAFGFITGSTLSNAYNVSSVNNFATGKYTVTLSLSLPSTNYGVLVTPGTPGSPPGTYPNVASSVQIGSASQFTFMFFDTKTYTGIAVPYFSFVVLQV